MGPWEYVVAVVDEEPVHAGMCTNCQYHEGNNDAEAHHLWRWSGRILLSKPNQVDGMCPNGITIVLIKDVL